MAITQKQAIEAVRGSRGFITAIAKRIGCERSHVYNLQKKWPKFAQAIIDEREALKDFAESKLFGQIDEGNTTAIIFYLKTQAKDRGYIERQELTGADGGPVKSDSTVRHEIDSDAATTIFDILAAAGAIPTGANDAKTN